MSADDSLLMRKRLARALRPANQALQYSSRGLEAAAMPDNAVIECGWGRLMPGQTWREPALLAAELLQERKGQRDIAFYVEKPHVVVASAPQQLFVDPSEAFRLSLGGYRPQRAVRRGFTVRRLRTRADVAAMNALYRSRSMVPVDTLRVWRERASRIVTYALAEDRISGEIIGVAMGWITWKRLQIPRMGQAYGHSR